jgi:DNA-binding CsgD family transcriptional regulator
MSVSSSQGLRTNKVRLLASSLSPREIECLKLFGVGTSDALIGQRLGIATRTVRFHFDTLKRKIGALTRAHALVLAHQQRVIDLDALECR